MENIYSMTIAYLIVRASRVVWAFFFFLFLCNSVSITYFFVGLTSVDIFLVWYIFLNHSLDMDEFVEKYLAEANEKISKYNADIDAQEFHDLFWDMNWRTDPEWVGISVFGKKELTVVCVFGFVGKFFLLYFQTIDSQGILDLFWDMNLKDWVYLMEFKCMGKWDWTVMCLVSWKLILQFIELLDVFRCCEPREVKFAFVRWNWK